MPNGCQPDLSSLLTLLHNLRNYPTLRKQACPIAAFPWCGGVSVTRSRSCTSLLTLLTPYLGWDRWEKGHYSYYHSYYFSYSYYWQPLESNCPDGYSDQINANLNLRQLHVFLSKRGSIRVRCQNAELEPSHVAPSWEKD